MFHPLLISQGSYSSSKYSRYLDASCYSVWKIQKRFEFDLPVIIIFSQKLFLSNPVKLERTEVVFFEHVEYFVRRSDSKAF